MSRCFFLALAVWLGHVETCPSSAWAANNNTADEAAYHQNARTAVSQVLESREFRHLNQEPSHWLRDTIYGALNTAAKFIESLPAWLMWIILIWMILTLVAILAHLIWTLVTTLRGSGGKKRGQSGTVETEDEWLGVRDLDFDSVYQRAQRLRSENRWADTVRHYYVAALLRLRDQQLLRYHKAKTNYDYVREIKTRPNLQNLLRLMTRSFDSVAYRGFEATISDVNSMDETLQQLIYETNLS